MHASDLQSSKAIAGQVMEIIMLRLYYLVLVGNTRRKQGAKDAPAVERQLHGWVLMDSNRDGVGWYWKLP